MREIISGSTTHNTFQLSRAAGGTLHHKEGVSNTVNIDLFCKGFNDGKVHDEQCPNPSEGHRFSYSVKNIDDNLGVKLLSITDNSSWETSTC